MIGAFSLYKILKPKISYMVCLDNHVNTMAEMRTLLLAFDNRDGINMRLFCDEMSNMDMVKFFFVHSLK